MTQPYDRKTGSSKGLSGKDIELWRAVTQNDDVLPGRGYSAVTESSGITGKKQEGTARRTSALADVKVSHGRPKDVRIGAGLERRTAQKLRRGQIPIDASLDLHGMTQSEAYAALRAALQRSQALGHRCLLVITGKGTGRANSGILKAMVPQWLDQSINRNRVLAFKTAQPQHGGAGAIYVLLRRQR